MNAPSAGSFRLTAMAAAVLAATGAWADERDDEIRKLTRPDSSIEAGVGGVSDDNTRFGQYNGMTRDQAYFLFDIRSRYRDDATGTWTSLTGRNLGLENRDLRFEQSRQGDWGLFLDYSQTPRYSPYTPVTRLTGFDTTRQTVNGAPTATPLEMKTERRALGLGFDKHLASRWDVRFSTRQEEKTGRRLFGRSGTDFLVDPIDYSTQQYDASLGYAGEQAQFTAGYSGSNFVNNKNRIDVVGGTGTGFSPIALPPGNESHQVNLGGGYSFTPTTRATYKFAYTHQTQSDSFIDTSTTGRTNLGGVVDTKFGQIGLSARPFAGLWLLADLRKENRDDKTPVVDYFVNTVTNTSSGVNEPRSIHSTFGKLEGTYQLPAAFRVTGGFDYDERRRNTSDIRVVSFREKTQEQTWRVDLRRSMSETLNGSIGYAHSSRGGSEWQTTTITTGANGSNLVHPLHLADRERDKVRATAGWTPLERLELQLRAEASKDEYSGRTLGLQDGSARLLSADAGYRLGETWQLNAWFSRDDTRANMISCASAAGTNSGDISACPNTAASPIWTAHLRNVGTAFGIGARGKATAKLELGAEFQLSDDRGEFRNGPAPAGVTPPPDVTYQRRVAKLSAKYAVQRNAGVRLLYVYDRFSTNDWTWETWTYSDGTRVLPNSQQKVNFFGLTGYYDF
jgi:MtrB/PioB family decaheme-associated outer membrane protein